MNRIIVCFLKLVMLLCVCMFNKATVSAQTAIVKPTFVYTKQLKAGDTLIITATFSVKKGFHLYAPTEENRDNGYQVTEFEFDPKLPDGFIRIGTSRSYIEPGLEAFGELRGDSIKLVQRFKYTGGNKDAVVSIKGNMVYQACEDMVCYPPSSIPVECKLSLVR